MSTSVRNIVITFSFILVLLGVMLANALAPHRDLSYIERRRFSDPPQFSLEKFREGKLALEFEKHALEQFVLRDRFRTLKAFSTYYLLAQRENNGVYLVKDGLYPMEYPLREKGIYNAAAKLNQVYDIYLQGLDVYYAVIPDKNFFLDQAYGYLTMDYTRMLDILHENVDEMRYIDLFSSLTLEDYYRTDGHWRQERIVHVADKLLAHMGRELTRREYVLQELNPFYGSYYGRSGLPLAPDTIAYFTNATLDKTKVHDQDGNDLGGVYNLEMFADLDPYSIFLSGPGSIITLENPHAGDGRELIIFRDSFASSLAPLLLEGYARIHLVDLRYISSNLLGEYLEFGPHQDVLFLYSIPVLNNSNMLR